MSQAVAPLDEYTVKRLDLDTWHAFARMAERHNGVLGGCWCTWFHTFHAERTFTAEGNRALKQRLVFDGDEAWPGASTAPPNGTRSLFEQAGVSYVRARGMKNRVMRKAMP
jgi:hypothetical protein